MKPLTIVYTTSRREPRIEWFFESLNRQLNGRDQLVKVIVVDFYHDERGHFNLLGDITMCDLKHVLPKPTVWQGVHKLTSVDWWAKSNALNTGICLCETEWIAFVDDRSVLEYRWLDRVEAAMDGNYIVCGYYEKHAGLKVENGLMVGSDQLLGADTRTPGHYPFSTTYGGHCALPLEWALAVNGVPEVCDGLGLDDSLFGNTLRNAGYPIHYDSDMRIFEDRTPGQIDGALKRADKNPHLGQQAKSWALVRMMEGQKTSLNQFDIRNMRDRVLAGELFPIATQPTHDFYDNQPLSEME